jgi:hypothetical protein
MDWKTEKGGSPIPRRDWEECTTVTPQAGKGGTLLQQGR